MKKLLSALIAVILLLSLIACARSAQDGKESATPDPSILSTESATPDPSPLPTAPAVSAPALPSPVDIKYGGVEAWNIRLGKEFQILITADENTTEIKAFEKSGGSRGSELSSSVDSVNLGENHKGFEISLIFNNPGDSEIIIVPCNEAGEGPEQVIKFTAKTDPQITAPGIVYTISADLESNYKPERSDLETPNFFGAKYVFDDTSIQMNACKIGSSSYAGYEASLSAFVEGFTLSEVTIAGVTAKKYAGSYNGGSYYAEMIIFVIGDKTYSVNYDTGDPSGKPHVSDYETLVQSIAIAG